MSKSLRLSRELYLPRSLVFDAWTQAEHVAEWYPPAGARVDAVVVQPTAGGRFELAWSNPDGTQARETGAFVEISRPEGFVCAVACLEAGGGERSTRLRLSLSDLDDACRIELEQSGVETEGEGAVRDAWDARLDRLEGYFSAI